MCRPLIVSVWPREVDVSLRYTRVLRAANECSQIRSFTAEAHLIVHESWLPVQLLIFACFAPGWFLSHTTYSKGAESRHVYISMFRAPGRGLEPKLYVCLLGLRLCPRSKTHPTCTINCCWCVASFLACKITSINSRISHYAPFIHHGHLQLRFLQFWIKKCWSQRTQPWDTQIELDSEYLTHLRWFNRKFFKESHCISRNPPCSSSPMHLWQDGEPVGGPVISQDSGHLTSAHNTSTSWNWKQYN